MYQRIVRRIHSLRRAGKALGPGNALLYALARGTDALSGGRLRIVKYYLVSQPVQPNLAGREPSAFTIDWADRECTLFDQIDRPREVIAARFAQNARCLVARAGESRLAGCLWFVVGPYEEDEVRVRYHPAPEGTVAWDFDVAIVPDYRMGRLFAYLWSRAAVELSRLGVTHSCSRISAFNEASLASHKRLRAQILGSATFVCAGRLQVMVATLSPWFHLSWRESRRPVITVRAAVGK